MSAIVNVYSLFWLLGDLRRVLVAMATTTMATGYLGYYLTTYFPSQVVLYSFNSTVPLLLEPSFPS